VTPCSLVCTHQAVLSMLSLFWFYFENAPFKYRSSSLPSFLSLSWFFSVRKWKFWDGNSQPAYNRFLSHPFKVIRHSPSHLVSVWVSYGVVTWSDGIWRVVTKRLKVEESEKLGVKCCEVKRRVLVECVYYHWFTVMQSVCSLLYSIRSHCYLLCVFCYSLCSKYLFYVFYY
jgi:hypothetical protein